MTEDNQQGVKLCLSLMEQANVLAIKLESKVLSYKELLELYAAMAIVDSLAFKISTTDQAFLRVLQSLRDNIEKTTKTKAKVISLLKQRIMEQEK